MWNGKSSGVFNSTKSFARRRQSNLSTYQYHLYGAKPKKKCQKYTEAQKYLMLERIGGRNQQFMANSADEASRNFPKLISFQEDPISTRLYDGYSADEFDMSNPLVDDFVCDNTCQEIRRKLGYLVTHTFKSGKKFMGPFGDDHTAEAENGTTGPTGTNGTDGTTSADETNGTGSGSVKNEQFKISPDDNGTKSKGCSLDRFITIGNCTSRGDEEVMDHEKLCTACQGIFVLNSDCFPSFLNAVDCGKGDNRCVFDHFTGYAQGKCTTKTLSFKVMHNRGTKDCEDWEFVYIDIPVACECFLSKTSFLDTLPNEET
ncbi:unnamed protein product [Bursaphelenchus okinawaensis]|uniref:Spaetzle domain-containing protein n=1 Tax=Bursaphelenchus okinawaensis TaxID=465554 RepID=A0A811LA93_9BILA|nr:unnamed protein product [Bursaphelenchus okinawaensis]CAG9121957.1 unnamed protein product [Bursaphelenchus okinawaensis]